MNPRMKVALALLGAAWLYAFFFGNFLHDKPHANTEDLATEVSIFRDVPLTIVQKESHPDGSWSLRAQTDFGGNLAGLQMDTGPQWKKVTWNGFPNGFIYHGKVTLRSLGEESDRLAEMLNQLYITGFPPKMMAPEVEFTAASVEGDPRVLGPNPVKIELFYETRKWDHVAEFYLDVDPAANRLTLMEKDTGYRKPILWALRGE